MPLPSVPDWQAALNWPKFGENFLKHQLPDGRFETQKGQFDANGQAVWTLWQFHKITIMLRHMLVHERAAPGERRGLPPPVPSNTGVASNDGELHLLSAVPDWWLADGKQIVVERAPTHFGTLDLRVKGEANGIRVEFRPPTQRPPRRIVLHLPKSRPPIEPVKGVEVMTRPDQKARWDYPTVVELYSRTAPTQPSDSGR